MFLHGSTSVGEVAWSYVDIPMIRGVGVSLKFPMRLLSAHTLRYSRELRDDDIVSCNLIARATR